MANDTLQKNSKLKTLSRENKTALHNMYVDDKILPGRIRFFDGMPIILRKKNLSVPLKATNGTQAKLKEVHTVRDEYDNVMAEMALIDIPGSPAKLSHLPEGVFPVFPTTSMFETLLYDVNRDKTSASIIRHQLPIEPGYCVTGHSAQGKTLPVVVSDPSVPRPGFYIYVAFSRAQRLEDIALLEETTLDKLNEPLHPDLRFELGRLKVLAHNTAVECGDIDGMMIDVPIHEKERLPRARIEMRLASREDDVTTQVTHETARDDPEELCNNKRNRKTKEGGAKKRMRTGGSNLRQNIEPSMLIIGPRWDPEIWSCAYDATFVSLFACWDKVSE